MAGFDLRSVRRTRREVVLQSCTIPTIIGKISKISQRNPFETAYIYYLELRNVQSMNRKNYIKRGITFFRERIPRIPRNRGFKLYLYRKLKRKQIQENSIITIEIKMEISETASKTKTDYSPQVFNPLGERQREYIGKRFEAIANTPEAKFRAV